jgi:hypothetical protein
MPLRSDMIHTNIELLYAFPEYKPHNLYEFVLLAIELLDQVNSEAMVIVAGFSKSVDIFEITPYLIKWKKDLHIPDLNTNDSLLVYAFPIVRHLAAGENIREQLLHLDALCIESGYSKELNDFYLLSNALKDLDYSDNQWYWKNLTKENSLETIHSVATSWLDTNAQRYNEIMAQ